MKLRIHTAGWFGRHKTGARKVKAKARKRAEKRLRREPDLGGSKYERRKGFVARGR